MAFDDGIADFRSDTVTRPTPEMRRAMAEAIVGDDDYGEDPTVNRLEEEAAVAVGKEAAVFVPSGTMGNQLALWCLTSPATEVICVETAHIRNYEHAAGAVIAGIQYRTVPSPNSEMTAAQIREAAQGAEYHKPKISLLAWENTHPTGGTILPFDQMQAGREIADELGIKVHLDGARIWNAVAATGIPGSTWAAEADTIQYCFSKALGAPVGSVLCGDADLVAEARYRRKALGGGMRQAGVLGAAALIALAQRERLSEDHALARMIAGGIADRYPNAVEREVPTNMVVIDEHHLPGGVGAFQAALEAAGIRVIAMGPGVLRLVTHRDVDADDGRRVLRVLDELRN